MVFDLDYTLWPFWVDTHPTPPLTLHPTKPMTVIDRYPPPSLPPPLSLSSILTPPSSYKTEFTPFSTTHPLLTALHTSNILVSLASRTEAPPLARQVLDLLHLRQYITGYEEIYPGSKVGHFRRLAEKSGVGYEEMVFFDDERRNREVEGKLGVVTVIVTEEMGCSMEEFDAGVRRWRREKREGEGVE